MNGHLVTAAKHIQTNSVMVPFLRSRVFWCFRIVVSQPAVVNPSSRCSVSCVDRLHPLVRSLDKPIVSHGQGCVWPLSVCIPQLFRGGQCAELPRRCASVGHLGLKLASVPSSC